jgi:hypothetical protein
MNSQRALAGERNAYTPLAAVLLLATAACGGQARPEPKAGDAASEPVTQASQATSTSDSAVPSDDSSPPAEGATPDDEASKGPSAASGAAGKTPDPNAPREVRYVLTPEGLKVEVAGVRFLATAESKQVAQGWGVRVSVKAEAIDGKPHVLLNAKHGPIAFAAAVFKKGSTEAERIPDEREGDAELKLSPGTPVSFSRDFPNKGGRVLGIGETLDLQVARWGLGETAQDRRPVKQFLHVSMKVEKGKPKPKLAPPESAAD